MSEESKKKTLHTTWFGTFILEGEEIIDKELFSKDPEKIAEKKFKIENGEVLEEEKKLASKQGEEIYVTSDRLSDLGELREKDIDIDPGEYSFDDSLLQEALLELGSKKVKESIDFGEHLAKAVDTIQDMNKIINMKLERLRDWYSLHFPELEDEVGDEEYVDLISRHGSREKILERVGLAGSTTGGEITGEEKELYKDLAGQLREDLDYREELRGYVEEKMKQHAPNLVELAGPKLGGELIAKQGSLKELAKQPASTIQVLGAENALFQHLTTGSKPPKHGLILQHPFVHDAPKSVRGKIARTFANKIAIAARLDYFDGEFKGEELREEVEKKIERIKEEG
ncbi:MAG: NOP58 family protein [Candidatus Thermoplasmatota archaeon]|nr:NOP58 family protein [Candidatus Thermoplasmatota archaeon]